MTGYTCSNGTSIFNFTEEDPNAVNITNWAEYRFTSFEALLNQNLDFVDTMVILTMNPHLWYPPYWFTTPLHYVDVKSLAHTIDLASDFWNWMELVYYNQWVVLVPFHWDGWPFNDTR